MMIGSFQFAVFGGVRMSQELFSFGYNVIKSISLGLAEGIAEETGLKALGAKLGEVFSSEADQASHLLQGLSDFAKRQTFENATELCQAFTEQSTTEFSPGFLERCAQFIPNIVDFNTVSEATNDAIEPICQTANEMIPAELKWPLIVGISGLACTGTYLCYQQLKEQQTKPEPDRAKRQPADNSKKKCTKR